jgi:hypothetical protein
MVGPISREEREASTRRIKAAFVLLVGVSGALITLQGDVALWVTAAAFVVASLVGLVLVWYVFPGTGETKRRSFR